MPRGLIQRRETDHQHLKQSCPWTRKTSALTFKPDQSMWAGHDGARIKSKRTGGRRAGGKKAVLIDGDGKPKLVYESRHRIR